MQNPHSLLGLVLSQCLFCEDIWTFVPQVERRLGAAAASGPGQPAGGREAEGDDLQHLQLCLRPEGEGRRGGR